jgi:hypothetical protein
MKNTWRILDTQRNAEKITTVFLKRTDGTRCAISMPFRGERTDITFSCEMPQRSKAIAARLHASLLDFVAEAAEDCEDLDSTSTLDGEMVSLSESAERTAVETFFGIEDLDLNHAANHDDDRSLISR